MIAGLLAAALAALVPAPGAGVERAYRIDNRDCALYGARVTWRDGPERLVLADCVTNGLRSPDGRFVVVGDNSFGRLRFVDLARRRLVYAPRAKLSRFQFASIHPLLWTRPDRVIAKSWTGDAHRTGASGLVVVDPVAQRVLRRMRLGEYRVLPGRTRAGEVVLFAAPRDRIGQARIVLVSPAGRISQISVRRIRAGIGGHGRYFNRVPGVAFDARRARVFLVAEGDGAAEVDLRTGRIGYHELRGAFASRPRRLAPPGESSGTSNPSRTLARRARWLGNGMVAVSGYDTWPTRGGNEQRLGAGLKLVDTRTWTVRTVDPLADHVVYAPGMLLVARDRWDPARRAVVGDGVAGYDVRGRRRFQVLAGRRAVVVRARGRRAEIWLRAPPKGSSPGGVVVALPSGRVVARWGSLAAKQ